MHRLWPLHLAAGLLVVAALVLRLVAGDALWVVLVADALGSAGALWFLAPLLARAQRFIDRGRRRSSGAPVAWWGHEDEPLPEPPARG